MRLVFTIRIIFILGFSLNIFTGTAQENWQSDLIKVDATGNLQYYPDDDGFLLPDFSYAGYKNGAEILPYIAIKFNRSPITGDNTAHLQSAIDSLALLPLDENGFRGAVLLDAGIYTIRGQLVIEHSGIVLRGVGNQINPALNTVLYGVGNTPANRDLIRFGPAPRHSSQLYSFEKVNPIHFTSISDEIVPVGSNSFKVYNINPFSVGDRILLQQECTAEWLEAIEHGGTASDAPWKTGSNPIIYDRTISKIEGNTITVHAPVFYTLDKSLAKTRVYPYPSHLPTINNVGIEHIRIDNEYSHAEDEQHVRNSVFFRHVENAWARQCTATHFSYTGFGLAYSRQVTIDRCNAIDPISKVDGSRRYNFVLEQGTQLILVRYCYASNGRHHFITNGMGTSSGNVFYHSISDGAYTTNEAHRYWSTGILFDNITEINVRRNGKELLGLHNRGDFGTSHGWSCAHCVAWNYNLGLGKATIHKPPTAQNYCIGCIGKVNAKGAFEKPLGYVEGLNLDGLSPRSLYLTQLQSRM